MCCRADTCNVLCPFDFMYPFPVRFCHKSHATRLVAIPCMRRQISKSLPCLQSRGPMGQIMCEQRFAFYGSQTVDQSYLISYMHVQTFKSMLESQVTPNCCVNMCLRPPLMQLQHSTKSWRPDLVFLPRNSRLVSMFRLHWLMSFYVANRILVYLVCF